ncbi:hypothetical protein PR202_ga10041 [Eleusine coracana subsp. coracana]|uniref:F-box domain-containing protein n=1 Tax=Eleusine coracana subsp. coracana TaxID=191504 RepID=A0AAV5C5P6_ELECO|nr:hypothetical protein PR202_ga10041 [Eleusine coracana subsp. coracana]
MGWLGSAIGASVPPNPFSIRPLPCAGSKHPHRRLPLASERSWATELASSNRVASLSSRNTAAGKSSPVFILNPDLPSARREMGSAEVMSSPNAPPQMGEDSEMSRRVHSTSTELGPAPALDDDNLLAEFLLRLPPLPSSLPRASLVCKRWRRLVSEPHFLRRFRSHHQKPTLLGFIYEYCGILWQ